ncbi:hypothetical protein DFH09DRAFT_1345484 [Mycena vulgaris]|nr:hypothetical protein DFH09DRAFT_1345484 [Mycena vulgaris]
MLLAESVVSRDDADMFLTGAHPLVKNPPFFLVLVEPNVLCDLLVIASPAQRHHWLRTRLLDPDGSSFWQRLFLFARFFFVFPRVTLVFLRLSFSSSPSGRCSPSLAQGTNPVLAGSSFIFDTLSAPLPMTKTFAGGSGSKKRKRSEPDAEFEDAMHGTEGRGALNDGPNTSSTAARTAAPPPKRRSHRAATVAPESSPSGPSSVKTPKGKSTPAPSKSKVKVPHVIVGSLVSKPPQAPRASSSAAPVQPPQPSSPKRSEPPDPAETFLGKVIPTDPRFLPSPFIIEDANDTSMFFHLEPCDCDCPFLIHPSSRSNSELLQYFATSIHEVAHRLFPTEAFHTPEWRETDDGQYFCRVIGERINAATCLSRVRGVLTTLDRFLSVFPPLHLHVSSYSTIENVFFNDPHDPEPVELPTEDFVPPKPPPSTGIKSAEERERLRALSKEDFNAHYAAWEQREIVAGTKYEAAMEAYVARRRDCFERFTSQPRATSSFHGLLDQPRRFLECSAPSCSAVSREPSVAPSVVSHRFTSVAGSQFDPDGLQLGDDSNFGEGDEEDELEDSPAPRSSKGKGKAHARDAMDTDNDEEEDTDGGSKLAHKGAKRTRRRDLPGHDPQAAVPVPECFNKKHTVDINPLSYQSFHHDELMSEGGKRSSDGTLINTGGFRSSSHPGFEGFFDGFEDERIPVSAAGPIVYFTRGSGCKKCKKGECVCVQPRQGYSMPEKCLGCSSSNATCNGSEGFDFTETDRVFERLNLYYFTELLKRSGWLYSRVLGHNTSDLMLNASLTVRKCGTFATGTEESRTIHIPEVFEPPALAEVAFVAASADLKFSVSDRFADLFQAAEERLLSAVGDAPPQNRAREHLALLDCCNFPDTDALVRSVVEELAAGPPGTTRGGAVRNGGMGEGSRGFLEDEDVEGELVDESDGVDTGFLGLPPAAATPGVQKSGKGFPSTPKVSNSAVFLDFPFGFHGSAPSTPFPPSPFVQWSQLLRHVVRAGIRHPWRYSDVVAFWRAYHSAPVTAGHVPLNLSS